MPTWWTAAWRSGRLRAPRRGGWSAADRLAATRIAPVQRSRHGHRDDRGRQARSPPAVQLHLRDLRQERRRRARRDRGSSGRVALRGALDLRHRQGVRRGPRARVRTRARRPLHRRAPLQHRRASPERLLRDGPASLRAAGARRRGAHRVRQRRPVALFRPRRGHGPGAAPAARQRRHRRVVSSTWARPRRSRSSNSPRG